MSDYAIFFRNDSMVYRLPVNPEELKTKSVQAIEKFKVLKLGQVAIPTHMELTEYSFEAEFPKESYHYVETSGDFKTADFYLNLFRTWRNALIPVRFIASNGISEDINDLVLIEDITEVEKAGEEGDKYLNFKLLEYREFSKKVMVVETIEAIPISASSSSLAKAKKKKSTNEDINPKNTGTYVVKKGDTLWAIAKMLYGDGSKCNIIYNANKDKIKNPALLQVGWILKVPDKSEFSKYSASLPKTVKNEPTITEYQGGVSSGGRTHSSGGAKF